VWRGGLTPYRIDSLCHYLPSLHHLKSLGLSSMHLGPDVPRKIGLFSAFQHTLSSLCLSTCHVTSGALITLINYFPPLANLELQSLTYVADHEPVPRLSRPLRGRLDIADCKTSSRALFENLSDPPAELNELTLRGVYMPTFYDTIFEARRGSVERLEMIGYASWGQRPFPTLSNCRGLRELQVSLPALAQDEISLLSSITSTNLQKIVLSARYGFERSGEPAFAAYYQEIDDCLCQLVERLRRSGYKHELEVALHICGVPEDEKALEEFLPKFKEQGRVTLMLGGEKRDTFCSDSIHLYK